MLRQRAISAAILIPPLVIALLLGRPWITIVIVVAAGLAAREVFQLLAGAGYPSLAWFGIAFTVGLIWLQSGSCSMYGRIHVPHPQPGGAGLFVGVVPGLPTNAGGKEPLAS